MKHSGGGTGISASLYGKVGQQDDDHGAVGKSSSTAAVSSNGVTNFDGVVDGGSPTVGVDDDSAMTYQKGEVQLRGYKDKWFAVAFLSHFVVLIGLVIAYAPTAVQNGQFGDDRRNLAAVSKRRPLTSTFMDMAETTFRELSNVGRAKNARVSGSGRRFLKNTNDVAASLGQSYYPEGGDDDETIEEVVEDIASYYDDDVVKETIEIFGEIIEDYYEEEQQEKELPAITYYGGAGGSTTSMMHDMSGSQSNQKMNGMGMDMEVEEPSNYTGMNGMGMEESASNYMSGAKSSSNQSGSYESSSFGEGNDDGTNTTFDHVGAVIGIAIVTGVVASPLFFWFLMKSPKAAIKTSLVTNVIYFTLFGCMGVANGLDDAGFRGFFFAFVSVLFGFQVWKRVSFSASLLKASTSAIMANLGVFAYSILTFIGSMIYYVLWLACVFATIGGMTASTNSSDGSGDIEDGSGAGLVITLFFLVVCFYWSIYVFAHVLHVTVAGTVGTYWFTPIEASSCCSKGLNHSFIRATTDSFGSICFASLLIAVIETLRSMARSNRRNGILTCIISCLLFCLAAFVELFNRWSLVYVGLYGYPFIEAGTNVLNLFKAKGWTPIVSECMVTSVIRLANLTIGVITGVVSGAIMYCIQPDEMDFEVGFWVGLLVGIIMSGNVFGVLLSASETVFVCFAEAPMELDENHPELGREMNDAWAESWPEIYQGRRSTNDLTLHSSETRNVV